MNILVLNGNSLFFLWLSLRIWNIILNWLTFKNTLWFTFFYKVRHLISTKWSQYFFTLLRVHFLTSLLTLNILTHFYFYCWLPFSSSFSPFLAIIFRSLSLKNHWWDISPKVVLYKFTLLIRISHKTSSKLFFFFWPNLLKSYLLFLLDYALLLFFNKVCYGFIVA